MSSRIDRDRNGARFFCRELLVSTEKNSTRSPIAPRRYWKGAKTKNGGDVFVPAQVGDNFRRTDGRYNFNDIKLIPATAEFFVQDRVGDRVEMSDFPFSLYPQVQFAMERASVPRRLSDAHMENLQSVVDSLEELGYGRLPCRPILLLAHRLTEISV